MADQPRSQLFDDDQVDYSLERNLSLVNLVYHLVSKNPGGVAVKEENVLTAAGATATSLDEPDAVLKPSIQLVERNPFLLVTPTWGQRSQGTPQKVGDTRLLLCDVSPLNLSDSSNRELLDKELKLKSYKCEISKWKDSLVVLRFSSDDDIRVFCSGLPSMCRTVHSAVSTKDVYPCFLHMEVPSASREKLTQHINQSLLIPFSGNLFLHVSDNSTITPPAMEHTGELPRFIILLSMTTRLPNTHSRYHSMQNSLSSEHWVKVDRASHKLENAQLYIHKLCPTVSFAVRLGSDMSCGIQFILNISSEKSMQESKAFYDRVFTSSGSTDSGSNQVEMLTYPLGNQYCELLLRYDPEAKLLPSSSFTSVCFNMKSLSHLDEAAAMADASSPLPRWVQMTDPDGNSLRLTQPLI